MVVKPVDGFAGRGVLHLRESDRNLNSLLELATGGGRVAIVAQQYLSASREGDKRIILLDGELLGAARIPQENDVRGNLPPADARRRARSLPESVRSVGRSPLTCAGAASISWAST
jgi:glutathione synthase